MPGAGQSLAAADVDLLAALQAARRADKSGGTPESKAAAWDTLARYAGKANPYKEVAERRREDWKGVAEAEVRHREQVAKVCAQYEEDSAKLAKLVALDDDVVSAKQKDGYKRELAQVYAPYRGAINECEASIREAAAADPERAAFRAVGLFWPKQPPAGWMPWADAKTYCAQLALAGGGWRLPTRDELKALYDSNTPHAPHGDWYWSSTPAGGSSAWHVSFASGGVDADGVRTPNRVRCVR